MLGTRVILGESKLNELDPCQLLACRTDSPRAGKPLRAAGALLSRVTLGVTTPLRAEASQGPLTFAKLS